MRAEVRWFLHRAFRTLEQGAVFRESWHHRAICHRLQRVARGECRRLIITVPPRSLKSVTVSVAFPAWLLGREPQRRILCVSYAREPVALLSGLGGLGALAFAAVMLRNLLRAPDHGSWFGALYLAGGGLAYGGTALALALATQQLCQEVATRTAITSRATMTDQRSAVAHPEVRHTNGICASPLITGFFEPPHRSSTPETIAQPCARDRGGCPSALTGSRKFCRRAHGPPTTPRSFVKQNQRFNKNRHLTQQSASPKCSLVDGAFPSRAAAAVSSSSLTAED